MRAAAPLVKPYADASHTYAWIGIAAMLALALAGGLYAFTRIRPDFRARSRVEKIVMMLLLRSEEHTSELQSLMRISYAVFCLKKKKIKKQQTLLYYYRDKIHKQSRHI